MDIIPSIDKKHNLWYNGSMYIAILGRQPEISLAEIRAQFGNGRRISGRVAEFMASEPDIDRFGGSLKFAKKIETSPLEFLKKLPEGKITLGVSDYSRRASAKRAGYEALKLKKALKKQGRSVRILPNSAPEISSAVACHEKLGRKPLRVELLMIEQGREGRFNWYVSVGAQDIEAYTRRDQARPARDAKVGMLPPKLAQILINLCGPLSKDAHVLDPFCGTGVVLQEARLMGYKAYGTDLSERIVGFAEKNMKWLDERSVKRQRSFEVDRTNVRGNFLPEFKVEVGDATNFEWEQPIDAVAAEVYLGPPMSQPPVEIKLKTIQQECGAILKDFLKNLSRQIKPGTSVVLAIPAWKRPGGGYARLNIEVGELGFEKIDVLEDSLNPKLPLDEKVKAGYNGVNKLGFSGLLYARPEQIVAREIIVLRKS